MDKKKLSTEQQAIMNTTTNCVVIATPGSGKTFTLSQKIKTILASTDLHDYQGVIAISFTNKASNELKLRTLLGNTKRKGSFFGTIDKFCISEIILSFGKHLFGQPQKEFQIAPIKQIAATFEDRGSEFELLQNINSDVLTDAQIALFKNLYYKEGLIILELIGLLANYILYKSASCQRYIKSRYTHIMIDEYQDSDFEQNKLFLSILKLGLTGIAVGDVRQAIFAFAGKDSNYLRNLVKLEKFSHLTLGHNFRCHPSISNYSKMLLKSALKGYKPILTDTTEIRVFEKRIMGNELAIAAWIEVQIPLYMKEYNISSQEKIAILVKNNDSGDKMNIHLSLPHRFVKTNPLDEDVSIYSNFFADLLYFVLDTKKTVFEWLHTYYDIYEDKKLTLKLIPQLERLTNELFKHDEKNDASEKEALIDIFVQIAHIFFPHAKMQKSIKLLRVVLDDNSKIAAYYPPKSDEIQIMTLHKSKGLEFDLVFHLNLYSYILPARSPKNWDDFLDINQDFNLHYVGLTRAKECCVLLHSSIRTNASGKQFDAFPSEFLKDDLFEGLEELKNYRIKLS